jgi:hypothetical protein
MAVFCFVFVRGKVIKYVLTAGYILIGVIAWNPGLSTQFARMLGMGRGLDLLFIISFFVVANSMMFLIIQLDVQHRKITKLVRKIAIMEASQKKNGETIQ